MNIPVTGYILIALLVSVSALTATPKHHLSHMMYDFTQEYGGNGGEYFQQIGTPSDVAQVKIRHGARIDSIQLCFRNRKCSNVKGGVGGSETKWKVPQGQYIVQVDMGVGDQVDSLLFKTNTGTNSPKFGGSGGGIKNLYIPQGKRIRGFFGRSGARIDRLGFIV